MIIKNSELSNIKQEAISLLKGAFDLYLHAAPDGFNRSADYLEVAREAELFKMAGLVFMVIVGGVKSIARVTDKVVPLMCGIYVLAAILPVFPATMAYVVPSVRVIVPEVHSTVSASVAEKVIS